MKATLDNVAFLFLFGESLIDRHCEERSNLYTVQSGFASWNVLSKDCFVPRNDCQFEISAHGGIFRTIFNRSIHPQHRVSGMLCILLPEFIAGIYDPIIAIDDKLIQLFAGF